MASNFSRSSASATSRSPGTTARYSSGNVAPIIRASTALVWGANSEGLSTAQLPAAIAPTSGESSNCSG